MIGAATSSLVHLVAISLGLGLACFGLANPDLLGLLIEGNQAGAAIPSWLFARLALVAGLTVLAFGLPALVTFFRNRRDRSEPFWRADRGAFLAFAFLVPLLAHKNLWFRHPVLYMGLLAVAGLVMMRDLSMSGGLLPRRRTLPGAMRSAERWLAPAMMWFAMIAYAVVISRGTILQHLQFGTYAWDFGMRVNYFWNTFQGDFLGCSYFHPVPHYFSMGHLTLTELLVAGPFYWLVPRPETLLVVQAAMVALGALPVFLLARHYLRDGYAGVILGIVYLLHPGVASANFYDFHEVSMLPFFGGMVLFSALTGRCGLFLLMVPLFLLIKEDMALMLLTFTPFLLSRRPSRRIAVLAVVISITWYFLARHVILPQYNSWDYSRNFRDVAPHSDGAVGVIRTVVTNPVYVLVTRVEPERAIYLLQVLVPLALVPLLRLRYLILLLYAAGITLLATDLPFRQISFQYVYYWFPGMMTSAVLVLRDMRSGWRGIDPRAALAAMAVLSVAVCYEYGYFLGGQGFRGGFHQVDHEYSESDARRREKFLDLVKKHLPPDASLAADDSLCPHLSERRDITAFRFLDRPVDYLLLVEGSIDPRAYRQYVLSGEFERLLSEDGFMLYRRRRTAGGGSP